MGRKTRKKFQKKQGKKSYYFHQVGTWCFQGQVPPKLQTCNIKSPTHYKKKERRGGGVTNLGKGIIKHGGIVKQQGAKRYLDKGVGKHDETTKQGWTTMHERVVKH